jgi:hypothetical protein
LFKSLPGLLMLGDPGVLDPGAEGEVGAPGVGVPPPGDPDGAPPPDVPPDPLPGAWATAGETRKKLTTASATLCLHMVSSPDASVCSRGLCFCALEQRECQHMCDMPGGRTLRSHVACDGLWRVVKEALPES